MTERRDAMEGEIGKKRRWSLKGHLMWFKTLQRTHFLPFSKKKTLLIMIFDDRAVYSYVRPVPIRKVIDGNVCELGSERVMIYDKRTTPTLKMDTEQEHEKGYRV